MSPEVCVVYETTAGSIVRDACTAAMTILIIGTGVLLESSAMQWLGFVMLTLAITGRALARYQNQRRTPQEAADWLQERFGVVGRAKDAPR